MTWFTNVEDIVYSFVEYIPLVGSIYSFKRAGIAYQERNWTRHWQSVANLGESLIRDIIIFNETVEPLTVVILHTMAESLTDKLFEHYFTKASPPFKIRSTLNKALGDGIVAGSSEEGNEALGHVVVAGSTKERSEAEAKKLFTGEAKGLHHFHGAIFTGKLKHPDWAPNGEEIRLRTPQGFYNNAPCQFSWKWTNDAGGSENRLEFTYGCLLIENDGDTTTFKLSSRFGVYPTRWAGYDFKGTIIDANNLEVKAEIDGVAEFTMKRVSGT